MNKGLFKKFSVVFAVAAVLIVAVAGSSLLETVPAGDYHITQAAVTGKMGAQSKPGTYLQLGADVIPFPNQETFFFTEDKDSDDDNNVDLSIRVEFADASEAWISGTARVIMPLTNPERIDLVAKDGFRSYREIEQKLVLPTVRRSLVLTANMMTARESYSDKRAEFISWAKDQIENGPYQTITVEKVVKDPLTGEEVLRRFKQPKEVDGTLLREHNPLGDTGIRLANFEIKKFKYSDRVLTQIQKQQEALMAVATAKAEAEQANQEKVKAEAQGQKAVMEAKYRQEQEKIKAIVAQEQAFATDSIKAVTAVLVAEQDKLAAKAEKEANVLRGQGEAERKRLVLNADGALQQKLDAWVKAQSVWAGAFQNRKVPTTFIAGSEGSGTNPDGDIGLFMKSIAVKSLNDLALDMTVPKGASK